MITAVIPTKDRPIDLPKAVDSILKQTRLPNELVIVDQSDNLESKNNVESLWPEAISIELKYIHDVTVRGLVDAKKTAVSHASGDIICFLEDDVVLELDYLEQIESGFLSNPDMIGCCGIVTNPPTQFPGYLLFFHVFHCGIFHDKRVGVHGKYTGSNNALIASNKLSGGISAWKKEVFSEVPFDVENGFFMLEDMDFSTRVEEKYGPNLYINPNARLAHNCSPINRSVLGQRQSRKITEFILFYKKRRKQPWALLSLLWLLVGAFFETLFQAITKKSSFPISGYFCGIKNGFSKSLVNT